VDATDCPADAASWAASADALGDWALSTLIVDRHSWSVVRRTSERTPNKLLAHRSGTLTRETVAQHFRGEELHHLLVVSAAATIPDYHAIPGFGWLGFATSGALQAQTGLDSWTAAKRIAHRLRALDLFLFVEHSDGEGRFHIWVPFRRESIIDWEDIKSAPVYEFAHRLLQDVELPTECFTTTLPLPGRHHSRTWWSKVWGGGAWLAGERAINALLALPPNVPTHVSTVFREFITPRGVTQAPSRRASTPVRQTGQQSSGSPAKATAADDARASLETTRTAPAASTVSRASTGTHLIGHQHVSHLRAPARARLGGELPLTEVQQQVEEELPVWPFFALAALLFVALVPLPYGYYTLLRWAVVAGAAYGALTIRPRPTSGRVALYVAVALPFVFLRMERYEWAVVDSAAGFFFLIVGMARWLSRSRRSPRTGLPR
jgi:hypothetical protein